MTLADSLMFEEMAATIADLKLRVEALEARLSDDDADMGDAAPAKRQPKQVSA